MTLYVVSGLAGVREDPFAWYESGSEKYWFSGVTFTKEGWAPNPISWGKYYIMTSDQGIGINEDEIALVENGNKALAVRLNPSQKELVRYNKLFHWATVPELIRNGPEHWSTWYEIKGLLKTIYPSQESQKILSVMDKWERTSHQTALWVEDALKNQADPQDTVEIYAAGHQWLWHNTTKGVVIAGHQKRVWGSARLHSGGAIINRGALPIYNGWLVGLDPHNKYLLRWNGRDVETSDFVFPYGPWDDHGVWRLWYWDQIILTPQNQLVIAPKPYYFDEDSLYWALFKARDSESDLWLVNHQGESLYLDLSEYPIFGETPFYPRERCMLIECADDHDWLTFCLISLSPVASVERTPQPLWQIKVAPLDGARVTPTLLCIKDGTTEVFVFMFDTYDENWGVGLINEQGQFWVSPFFVKEAVLDYCVDANGVIKNDRFVVEPSESLSMLRAKPKVIRIADGQVHVEHEPGITMSDPLTSFPEGENNLWPHLVFALGLARATEEWHRLATIGRTV